MRFQFNWTFIGLILAAGFLAEGCYFDRSTWEIALRLQFAALIVHQFEEYTLPGGFVGFYNSVVYRRSPLTRYPLGNIGVLLVNCVLSWPLYIGVCIFPDQHLLAFGLAAIHVLNAFAHLAIAAFQRRYNPGVISGAFLLVPSAAFVIFLLVDLQIFEILLVVPFAIVSAIVTIQGSIFVGSKLDRNF